MSMIPKTIFIPLRNFKENQPGAEKAHFYLTKFLAQYTDYKIILYCSHIDHQESIYLMKYKNVRVIQQKKHYFFLLNYFILKFKPDIMLSWRWEYILIASLALMFINTKNFCFIHGFIFKENKSIIVNNFIYLYLLKITVSKLTEVIFCPSTELIAYMEKIVKVNKFKLLYNFKTNYEYLPKGNLIDKKNIMYIGGMNKNKGFDEAINIAKKNLLYNFHFYGNNLKQHNSEYPENVFLHGYSNDIKKEMLRYDVLLYPSKLDNLPFGIIEALEQGMIIISTDVGELKYILQDNVNSFIFDGKYFEFKKFFSLNNDMKLANIRNNAKETYKNFFGINNLNLFLKELNNHGL